MDKETITTSAKNCTKWQIATLLLSITTIIASASAAYFWRESSSNPTQLNTQHDTNIVQSSDQKDSDKHTLSTPTQPDQISYQVVPAGLTDLNIRDLNQAYSDYVKKQSKHVPGFKLTILPQLSSAEQYIKLNKKQTHIIAMLDIVFENGGAKGLFYRPVNGGKWICAAAAHQFPDDSALSDEVKKVFADDKFWGNN